MSQPSRAKPNTKGTHLASINFTKENLEYLNGICEELGMNRSGVVNLILKDYMDAGKRPRIIFD